jgi:hypothetical protein
VSRTARGTFEVTVTPQPPDGSGTGDLASISGALALTIDDRGHTCELTYTLD